MKPVKELLSGRAVVSLKRDATALEAARAMATQKVGCILITDREGRPEGIFTERDLMTRIVVPTKDPNRIRLEEAMTTELYLATAESTIREVRREMRERHIRHLPVVEDGKLIAVLSLRDLLRADLKEQQRDVQAMTAYIQGEEPEA